MEAWHLGRARLTTMSLSGRVFLATRDGLSHSGSMAGTGPVLRPDMFPDIPAAPANGLTCIVTFDARNGSPGFEG